jgi:alkanesulfonate monooxygenase SsuD/methylene tetrahydromethanopterin reductase-like flavin-dependent oxidoreductase (luciferase family)
MRVLLDECVPVQVARALAGHEVTTVQRMGWRGRENGDVLAAAEQAGFDLFVIADKNLRYQQSLAGRRIAILELWTNHRPTLEKHFARIRAAAEAVSRGDYCVLAAS